MWKLDSASWSNGVLCSMNSSTAPSTWDKGLAFLCSRISVSLGPASSGLNCHPQAFSRDGSSEAKGSFLDAKHPVLSSWG